MARRAFVFGANGPQSFGTLSYAVDDARRVGEALAMPSYAFAVLNASGTSDKYAFLQCLDRHVAETDASGAFVFYFSGHGELYDGKLYLVLDETDPNQVFRTAVPVSHVFDAIGHCEARNTLVILDCCHAGAALGYKKGPVQVEQLAVETSNKLILFASGRLEKAREFEFLKGSFLAHSVVAFFESGASPATVRDLANHLVLTAKKHNKTADRNNRVPVPFLHGQSQGEFVLSDEAAAAQAPEEISTREMINTRPRAKAGQLLQLLAVLGAIVTLFGLLLRALGERKPLPMAKLREKQVEGAAGAGRLPAPAPPTINSRITEPALVGCSDGTREAFVDVASHPNIAGCGAHWDRASLRGKPSGQACGNSLPGAICNRPSDACAPSWHICGVSGPGEVRRLIPRGPQDCIRERGAFAMAVGDVKCEPCTETANGYGAACCGAGCLRGTADCVWKGATDWWGVYEGFAGLCGAIENRLDINHWGVLCCKGTV